MIRRSPRRDRWVVIDNDTIRDEHLSWKARGLLAYLLSMPDNWTARATDLANRGPEGEHAVRAGLKELEEARYLIRERVRQDDGTFQWFSTVHERPVCPDSGFPHVDEPHVENGQVSSTQEEVPKKKNPLPPKVAAAPFERGLKKLEKDRVWSALEKVWGKTTTVEEGNKRGAVVKKLIANGTTDPDEIEARGRRARARWDEATQNVLLSRWSDLGQPYKYVDPHGLNAR